MKSTYVGKDTAVAYVNHNFIECYLNTLGVTRQNLSSCIIQYSSILFRTSYRDLSINSVKAVRLFEAN